MKRVVLLALPLAMVMLFASAVRAEEKKGEWNVTVGCAKCSYSQETGAKSCGASAKLADGKVVALKGEAVKSVKFKQGGEYVVTGTLSEDGKSIDVASIKKKEA